ncbi:MAG: hypothetical protein IAE82_08870 [Opitutaceae bacterium]|nr:hypothetical protein [Opitutaceae bacterium]
MLIYYLDDQPSQRQMLEWDLKSLFADRFTIEGLPLHPDKADYHKYLDDHEVAGVLVDQRLNETGEITTYTGLDLAKYLRGVYPEMPIFLVTGFDPDEQIKSADSGSVEAVVFKFELRTNTPAAEGFKQRFLRHVGRYQEALTVRQKRFRELLGKSVRDEITPEEKTELAALEAARLLPTQAEDDAVLNKLQSQVGVVEQLLQKLRDAEQKK